MQSTRIHSEKRFNTVTHGGGNIYEILKEIDQEFLKETISGEHFAEYFYPNCQDDEIANYLKSL